MGKKPYHHGNLEEALIEAGLSLVDQEGVERISLRRVAAACSVSHAAPYKHFSSKEDLLTAMQRYVEMRFAEVLEKSYTSKEGCPDSMIRMAQAYLRFFQENPHYFSFFQRQQEGSNVNLNCMQEESNYRPFEVFKQAAVKNLKPLQLTQALQRQTIIAMWAMVHGYTAISVMSGVHYNGDWEELLASILASNLTVEGAHFEDEANR